MTCPCDVHLCLCAPASEDVEEPFTFADEIEAMYGVVSHAKYSNAAAMAGRQIGKTYAALWQDLYDKVSQLFDDTAERILEVLEDNYEVFERVLSADRPRQARRPWSGPAEPFPAIGPKEFAPRTFALSALETTRHKPP